MTRSQQNEFADTQALYTAGGQARPHHQIDARELSSPLPILRAHRALRNMEVGQVLRVLTGHPQTLAEFRAMVNHVPGCELLSQEDLGDHFVHLLRRWR